MGTGVSVALMGVDGAGKTTLAKALRRAVAAAGIEVVEATWAGIAGRADLPPGYPRSTIDRLGVEGWRLMYAGSPTAAVDADDLPGPVYDSIPELFDRGGPAGINRHLPHRADGVHQVGPVVSALVEFAGMHLVQAEVVAPALRRGALVLSDSFPVRNAVKALRLARHMPDPGVPADTLDRLVDLLVNGYGDPHLQPDVGLLLDADPALTHRWRLDQHGRTGPAEDLSLTGRAGPESYVRFQTGLAEEYRAIARTWGWHTLRVDGRPAEQTAREALDLVLGHERLRGRPAMAG